MSILCFLNQFESLCIFCVNCRNLVHAVKKNNITKKKKKKKKKKKLNQMAKRNNSSQSLWPSLGQRVIESLIKV